MAIVRTNTALQKAAEELEDRFLRWGDKARERGKFELARRHYRHAKKWHIVSQLRAGWRP